MTSWGYKINQWGVWQRCVLLLIMIVAAWGAWYFSLEKPLLENNKAVLQQQAHDQVILKELNALTQLRGNFVYKNNLQAVQLRQVFQNVLSGVQGLTITTYNDNPVVALPAGANQFTQLPSILGISLLSTIQQLPATIVFSGKFDVFLTYLKALQNDGHVIYFDSVDFKMNRYPKAEITMKVFTLGG